MAIKMVGRVSTRTRAAAAGERHEERKKGRKKREKEKKRKKKVREEREKRVERNDTVNAAPSRRPVSLLVELFLRLKTD